MMYSGKYHHQQQKMVVEEELKQYQQQQQHNNQLNGGQKMVRVNVRSQSVQQQSSASVFAMNFEQRPTVADGKNDLSSSGWRRLVKTKMVELKEIESLVETSSFPQGSKLYDHRSTAEQQQNDELCKKMMKLELEIREMKQLCFNRKIEKELNETKQICQNLQTENKLILDKLAKMEQQQNGNVQQPKLPMPKTSSSQPQRQRILHQKITWDVNTCHNDLAISENRYVTYKGQGHDWRSVFAKCQISRLDLMYFEVKFLSMTFCAVIGFSNQPIALDAFVDDTSGTYSYFSNGYVRLNDSYKGEKMAFARGDVVGCGINFKTNQMFFTRNGVLLDTNPFFGTSISLFCPFISLWATGDLIEANFGPSFKFNFSTLNG